MERVREDFNYNTQLIGNGRDFLRAHFPKERLENIIKRNLPPILARPLGCNDKLAEIAERITEMIDRAELEGVNAFYDFYQAIAERLAAQLLQRN